MTHAPALRPCPSTACTRTPGAGPCTSAAPPSTHLAAVSPSRSGGGAGVLRALPLEPLAQALPTGTHPLTERTTCPDQRGEIDRKH
eukprot:1138543-Pelagomonas_calceolata.AAC.2